MSSVPLLKIGVLMGGPSAEHEVSLASGGQVLKNLDKNKYRALVVKVSKTGRWFLDGRPLDYQKIFKKIDLAFLALHGEFGEDGRLQGLLDFHNVSYTGSGRLASALGMDKLKSREIFNLAGLKTPRTKLISTRNLNEEELDLAFPLVVKPRSRGSSVGVFVVKNRAELTKAIKNSKKFDEDTLLEEFLLGTEVTCGVLENFKGQEYCALPVTEIRPKMASFFDYQSKYTAGASEEITPALISAPLTSRVQEVAVRAHQLLGCTNYSRADFIIKDNQPFLLEVNTLPGLTQTSLLPPAAAIANLTFSQLLDIIISNSLT